MACLPIAATSGDVRVAPERMSSDSAAFVVAQDGATAGLEIDIATRIVRRQGQWIDLTRREFELLSVLVRRAPQVVPRAELLRTAWSPGQHARARTVDMHVCALRRKLEPVPDKPRHIRTVSGVGYRFAP